MKTKTLTPELLRPLPAFGLLFPHLCSSSPCLDDSKLRCFLKYRRPLCPVTVSCDIAVWNKDVKLEQSPVPVRAGVGFMRRRPINWE
jgi:hypothetical protein